MTLAQTINLANRQAAQCRPDVIRSFGDRITNSRVTDARSYFSRDRKA
jgi:hypothetical protein